MWAQVSDEELCWYMTTTNMQGRILRKMIKSILDNDTDQKFSNFLDISKAQFELCGGIVPPSNPSTTFSFYQMVVFQIRQSRKMIKQEGDYDSTKKGRGIVFPSNATQRQHLSIAKNYLDNNDPGWDDTDDEDVDDLNGVVPESEIKKLKTENADRNDDDDVDDDVDNDDADNDNDSEANGEEEDKDDDDYKEEDDDEDEDDEDDEDGDSMD